MTLLDIVAFLTTFGELAVSVRVTWRCVRPVPPTCLPAPDYEHETAMAMARMEVEEISRRARVAA